MSHLLSILLVCGELALSIAQAASVEQQRTVFLQAEQALKQNRFADADRLLAELADYPLHPYLLYQKISKDLDNTQAIEDFLTRFGQTRQAELLRRRWLERLAAREAWADYAQNYRESDNTNLQCLYYLSLANLDRKDEAYQGAARLWPTGNNLPASCEKLFGLWQADGGFTVEDIWNRYGLAMRKDNQQLATLLRNLLPDELKAKADFWKQVHDDPRLVLSCSGWNPSDPISGRIFAHGIDRLASTEPLLAQTAWAWNKGRFNLESQEAARIDRRTALGLAAQRYGQASAYLLELPKGSADAQTRGWRLRSALAQQDWQGVLAGYELLDPLEKNQAQWLYWRARALEATGDGQGAREDYLLAARERDFYGFNAADHVGAEYPLHPQPMPVADAELINLANTPAFRAISELLALRRDGEARSEWMHAIKTLAPKELIIAAKLAQQWGLDNLAINTASRAGYWDDLNLRFPLGQENLVLPIANAQQVAPTLVYGVIRRESAFDANAGSPVGALGLMQLMPATGEAMAKRLKETLPSANALLDPERNIRYGATYLKGLLEKFGGHFALAAAAYNAGPGRVERWLPAEKPLAADLWVETIPFSETRQYVAAVLSHAVIYQARLDQGSQGISAFMREIGPGTKAETKQNQPVAVPACEPGQQESVARR